MAQKQEIAVLTRKIHSVLTPDLLLPEWRERAQAEDALPFVGHCYAAADALYHLLGGKEAGWKPVVLSHESWPEGLPEKGMTHRFLQHEDGTVADPTAAQFGKLSIPYDKGKGSGFMTKGPSSRAQIILERLGANPEVLKKAKEQGSSPIRHWVERGISASGKNAGIVRGRG